MVPSLDLELELETGNVCVIVHYFPETAGEWDHTESRIQIVAAFLPGADDPIPEAELDMIRSEHEDLLLEMADDWWNEESSNWDDASFETEEYWAESLCEWDYY